MNRNNNYNNNFNRNRGRNNNNPIRHPEQRDNRDDEREEYRPQPPQRNPRPQQVRHNQPVGQQGPRQVQGIARSLGRTPPGENAFKPTNLSTNDSELKNDALVRNDFLVDGLEAFTPKKKTKEFSLDFSQYTTLIEATYTSIISQDRGLAKKVSLAMFNYYATVLLWKRVLYVLTERDLGVTEYTRVSNLLSEFHIPDELNNYLNGVGNITDPDGVECYLRLLLPLSNTYVDGMAGHYDRVSDINHHMYETTPSPFVALYRVGREAVYTASLSTDRPLNPEWDLPVELRPDGNFVPNRNLLGWYPSQQLSADQVSSLQGYGLSIDPGEGTFEFTMVRNVQGIPIVIDLMRAVDNWIVCAKTGAQNNCGLPANVRAGSQGLVCFGARTYESSSNVAGVRLIPVQRRAKTMCSYVRLASNIEIATISCVYRMRRKASLGGDCLCYTGPHGGAPPHWLENAEEVFEDAPIKWNEDMFSSAEHDPTTVAKKYSQRVRKIVAY